MLSLLFHETGLLSVGVLVFRHSGWLPLFLASGDRVLEGDGFEVVVSDVKNERSPSPKTIYYGEGTWTYSSNLEIGIIIEETEVGVSLGKLGQCN